LPQKRGRGEEGQTNTFSFLEKKKTCAKRKKKDFLKKRGLAVRAGNQKERKGKAPIFIFYTNASEAVLKEDEALFKRQT